MKSRFFIHFGPSGTFRIGFEKGGNLQEYRFSPLEGRIDFYFDVEFDPRKSLKEAVEQGLGLFFQKYASPKSQQMYEVEKDDLVVQVLLTDKLPKDKDEVFKLIINSIEAHSKEIAITR